MTQSRLSQVCVDETPYYHRMTRCVRRAYLCGQDRVSGKNFDHRKPWAVERLRVLSSVFAIDVCAYAVMSNHLHVVLHVDRERAQGFGADEVVERPQYLHPTQPRGDPCCEGAQQPTSGSAPAASLAN